MRLQQFPPAIVIHTQRGLKDWQAGVTNGPLVRIRPGYEADEGLLKHELVHVAQWWAGVLLGVLVALTLFWFDQPQWTWVAAVGSALHPLAYRLVPRYRLWAEVTAYRVQARSYQDDRRALFAGFIASRYDLAVTEAQALAMLEEL